MLGMWGPAGSSTPSRRSTSSRQKQRPVTEYSVTSTSQSKQPSQSAEVKDSPPPTAPIAPISASITPSRKSKKPQILFYDKNDWFYEFTNFSPHHVIYKKKRYPTSEHLFLAFKFLGDNPDVAEHIRTYDEKPTVAFDEARRFQGLVRSDWRQVRVKKMEVAIYYKFTQHSNLEALLLGTGDAELIYDFSRDNFWGIGGDHPGRNELGKALMRVRATLREEQVKPYKAPVSRKDTTRLAGQDLTSGTPTRSASNVDRSRLKESDNPRKTPSSRKDNIRHSVPDHLSLASAQPASDADGPPSEERDKPYKSPITRQDSIRHSILDRLSFASAPPDFKVNQLRSEERDNAYKIPTPQKNTSPLPVQDPPSSALARSVSSANKSRFSVATVSGSGPARSQAALPQGSGPRKLRSVKIKNMCEACHTKPKYVDGAKTHPYCSRTCAAKMKNMCEYCRKRPRYDDGETTHPFCGRTCAQQAKAAGVVSGGTPSTPLKNGCLLCGQAATSGLFCSQACNSIADQNAPLLLEAHSGHDTFKSVADQFVASWRHPTPCPTVHRVYKVVGDSALISRYEAYRASVEARGNFTAAGRSPGNENRRWHGTRRECFLGDNGNTTLCSSFSCSLCNIVRTSYSLSQFGKKTGWGRFGSGIYVSSTSSKSNDYSNNVTPSNHKAILLNKVVVGKGYKMTQDNTNLTAPPPGYDSVLAEVAAGGSLNYDELVCYTEDAVRPSYLVIYDA